MKDTSEQINLLISSAEEYANAISAELETPVSRDDVVNALVDVLNHRDFADLLNSDWTVEEIKSTLSDYNFERLHPTIIESIELKDSIIPEDIPRLILEEEVKQKGEKWVIHKNDADPLPSNPHAHNYENGYKLHLGTGGLYIGRELMGKMRKKHLIMLREKIKFRPLPELE